MPYEILGPDDPALGGLQRALQQNPDLGLTLTIVPWEQYREKMLAGLNGPEASYAAVCVPGHVWLPELVEDNVLAPLDYSALPPEIVLAYAAETILPELKIDTHYEGRNYLVPLFTDGHVILYRGDLIPAIHNRNQPAINPGELADLVAPAHRPPGQYGLALKAHPSEILLDWLPFLWAAGGQLIDEAGQPAFDSSAGQGALQQYVSLRRFCPPDTHTYGNHEIATALKTGQVALAPTWGGQAAPILLDPSNPYRQLYQATTYIYPWNTTWGIGLAANQSHTQQWAVTAALLKATGAQFDYEVTWTAGSPVRESSYSQEQLATFSAWLPAQRNMLRQARPLPVTARLNILLGPLAQAISAAFNDAAAPTEALAEARFALRTW